LKSTDWVLGNRKRPIVAPDDDDRRVIGWTPTAAEREAIEDKNSSAPQVDGNINNSDYDFCGKKRPTQRSAWWRRSNEHRRCFARTILPPPFIETNSPTTPPT
jgi:hypothetical protein